MTRTMWAAAVLAAGLLAGWTDTASATVAPTASAAVAPTTTSSGAAADLRGEAAQDCKLIRDLGPAVADLLAVVNGDASTPGSVAWLDAGAAKARAAGHPNLAAWLTSRATLRQEQGAVPDTRQQMLANGASWCRAHGFGAAS